MALADVFEQRMAGQHLSREDLVSFGRIGLLQGSDTFDPAKGKRLSTYATWWIRQAIGRGIAEHLNACRCAGRCRWLT
jgi:RNA polymerase primary sigma factor